MERRDNGMLAIIEQFDGKDFIVNNPILTVRDFIDREPRIEQEQMVKEAYAQQEHMQKQSDLQYKMGEKHTELH